jgi:hypothetical protein
MRNWTFILPLAAGLAAASLEAGAVGGMFATEAEAAQACAGDEVVWVDLDRGRFYHKEQADYNKSKNGGFTCFRAAHAQYRAGH